MGRFFQGLQALLFSGGHLATTSCENLLMMPFGGDEISALHPVKRELRYIVTYSTQGFSAYVHIINSAFQNLFLL